jgi:predicted DNA-binding protein
MATKDERIGVRVPKEIKVALQNIAKKEGRSLAQVCELLLKGGIGEYEREGPDYLRRLLTRPRDKSK